MATVLRFRPGQPVLVLDNAGACYRVELSALGADAATGVITQQSVAEGEPGVAITLFQALLKSQKWDYLLQKGTEVGVSAFVPLVCQRGVVRLDGASWSTKAPRWEAILQEAAEQSGRGRIPTLGQPLSWAEACRASQGLALLAHTGPAAQGLGKVLNAGTRPERVSIYVGPEGGFTEEEVATAQRHGIQAVSLGPRTLRAETAGLVAASAVLYALGELG